MRRWKSLRLKGMCWRMGETPMLRFRKLPPAAVADGGVGGGGWGCAFCGLGADDGGADLAEGDGDGVLGGGGLEGEDDGGGGGGGELGEEVDPELRVGAFVEDAVDDGGSDGD